MADDKDDLHKTIRKFIWQIVIASLLVILVLGSGKLSHLRPSFNQWSKFSTEEQMVSVPLKPEDMVDRSFTLVNTNGDTVTERVFATRAWVVFFGFTRCPDICPFTLSRLTSLWGKLPNKERAVVLFVSVDPERDTYPVLADYMKSFDPSFVALTGSKVHIEQIKRNFHVYAKKTAEPGATDYTMDHTAAAILLRSDGAFMGTIDVNEPEDSAFAKLERLTHL